MDSEIQDINPEELAECQRLVEGLKSKVTLWATSFNLLFTLKDGGDTIKDIFARYEKQGTIEKFDVIFASLLQNAFILQYSDEEWFAFYSEFIKDLDLTAYIDAFNTWVFAKSFASAMYRHKAASFESFTEEEKEKYLALQAKYIPVSLQDFLIVRQILDKLLLLDDRYKLSRKKPFIYKEQEN